MLELYNRFATRTFCSQEKSKKMIPGPGLIFGVPGSKWHCAFFDFEWKSGLAKTWRPNELIGVLQVQHEWSQDELYDGHFLKAAIVTTNLPWLVFMSKRAPDPIPDLFNRCFDTSYGTHIYIYKYVLQGVAYLMTSSVSQAGEGLAFGSEVRTDPSSTSYDNK